LDILLCPFNALDTDVTEKPILLAKSLIFIRFLEVIWHLFIEVINKNATI